jgi:tetratricopeptide (TPR) repeat protein
MRAFVFTDESLARRAGQFVWLSVNTELAKNADFLKKYPVQAYPSFFVIRPDTETAAYRWMGGATVAQLQKILDDGRRAVRPGRGEFETTLAKADRLYGAGKNAEAATLYRRVLALAPKGWGRYGRTVESLLFALESSQDSEGCAREALEAYPRLSETPSAANVASSGLGCSLDVSPAKPGRAELVAALEKATLESLANPRLVMSADDRSGVYQTLISAREDAKDEAGQRKMTEEWSAFLDGEAARAKTPEQRSSLDPHRLSAYLALKEPEKAVPMLEASERDLPNDYNPPARLALAYKAMGRYDDALSASDRALSKAYGPRKVGILRTRAEIYQAMGKTDLAASTLEEAISFSEKLPAEQRSESRVAALRKKLGEILNPGKS